VEECFYLSFLALNLAEKYQLPVFVLVDKYLSESMQIMAPNQNREYKIDRGSLVNERMLDRLPDFHRFEITDSGISPRSIPGQRNGIFLANSDESDVDGYTNETSENRILKVNKRFAKMQSVASDMPEIDLYGDVKSKLCFITWGSTKGAVLEAMRRLQSIGKSSKLIALNYIEPFPAEEIVRFIQASKVSLVVEGNATSQLSKLITQNTGLDVSGKILKYDGRPLYPDEIVNYVLESVK
jgi:2-oxoglutarate ferredoxin oxidoreductase subunit alpha